jgi:hypothetical protein
MRTMLVRLQQVQAKRSHSNGVQITFAPLVKVPKGTDHRPRVACLGVRRVRFVDGGSTHRTAQKGPMMKLELMDAVWQH